MHTSELSCFLEQSCSLLGETLEIQAGHLLPICVSRVVERMGRRPEAFSKVIPQACLKAVAVTVAVSP